MIPTPFLNMLPCISTIVVPVLIISSSQRLRAPASMGIPHIRGGDK